MYVIIYIYIYINIIQYCTYMYIRRKKKCATLPINSKIDTEVSHKIEKRPPRLGQW